MEKTTPYIRINITHTNESIGLFPDKPFDVQRDAYDNGYYRVFLDVCEVSGEDCDIETTVATISLICFPIMVPGKPDEDPDIVAIADAIDSDVANSIYHLVDNGLFEQHFENDWYNHGTFTAVYIETFYVYPDFRGRGYGRYLHENLTDIVETAIHSNVLGFVTVLAPKKEIDGVLICMDKDEPGRGDMLEKMRRNIEHNNFHPISSHYPDCYYLLPHAAHWNID